VVLGTDFATRDGGDRGSESSATAFGAPPNLERAADGTLAESDSFGLNDTPGAGLGPPEAASGAEDASDVPAAASTACDAVSDVDPQDGVPDFDPCPELGRNLADPNQYAPAETPLTGGISAEDDADTKQAMESAANASAGDDGGGNRIGFVAVEIIAGVIAAGAAVAYIVSRRKRSEV
jgi:hypothetical protein